MKILYRYIFKECFLAFLLSLFAFTTVLITVRMLRLMSLIVNKGVEFHQVLQVFISIIPTFLEVALPLSALLGVILAFARMSGDSELVVIRASGVGLKQLITPVILFGLFVLVLSAFVSLWIRPWGYRNLNNTLFDIARSKSTVGLDSGVFSSLGKLTIYSEDIEHSQGLLLRVLIDDRRLLEQRKIIVAKRGKITSDSDTETISFDLSDGTIHEIISGKYVTTQFQSNSLALSSDELLPEGAREAERRSKELNRFEIQGLIEETSAILAKLKSGELSEKDLKQSYAPYQKRGDVEHRIYQLKVELLSRLSLPVTSFVLALIAFPLGIHPARAQRTWGIGLSIGMGLLAFLLYYGSLSLGLAICESSHISPLFALWIPNILIATLGLFLIHQLGSERWQSVSEKIVFLPKLFSRRSSS